jgi:4-aminobutyrate aminotransferase-like enzyme
MSDPRDLLVRHGAVDRRRRQLGVRLLVRLADGRRVRMAPPLTIGAEEVGLALEIIDDALTTVTARAAVP